MLDTARFDRLTRLVNQHTSRRGIARGAAGGLLAAALLAQLSPAGAGAQEATPAADTCAPATSEESAALARAYFDAFNAGDADALGDVLSDDYGHQGALVATQDKALHQERLRQNHAAFPDGVYSVEQVIANGDLAAVRWVFTGTLQAPYAGVEPAGQEVAVRGVHIHRIACGQIVETWNNGDGLGLLRQIGALPPAPPSPRTPEHEATPQGATPENGECVTTTPEENAAIARRWTVDALDQHNLDVLDEIVFEGLIHHAGIFVDEIGRDALKADLQALLDGFPDIRFTADVIVTEGDHAAVRWTGSGTHDAEFLGIPPTGNAVVFSGINFYRLACGQIVEGWSEPDSLGLMRQLGVIPEVQPVTAPEATPAG